MDPVLGQYHRLEHSRPVLVNSLYVGLEERGASVEPYATLTTVGLDPLCACLTAFRADNGLWYHARSMYGGRTALYTEDRIFGENCVFAPTTDGESRCYGFVTGRTSTTLGGTIFQMDGLGTFLTGTQVLVIHYSLCTLDASWAIGSTAISTDLIVAIDALLVEMVLTLVTIKAIKPFQTFDFVTLHTLYDSSLHAFFAEPIVHIQTLQVMRVSTESTRRKTQGRIRTIAVGMLPTGA